MLQKQTLFFYLKGEPVKGKQIVSDESEKYWLFYRRRGFRNDEIGSV